MKKGAILFLFLILIPCVCAEELQVTEEHPFLINNEWIPAKQLVVGDLIQTYDGKKARITSIEQVNENVPVYNLEDSYYHNYLVTRDNLIVHNSGLPKDILKQMYDFTKTKNIRSSNELEELLNTIVDYLLEIKRLKQEGKLTRQDLEAIPSQALNRCINPKTKLKCLLATQFNLEEFVKLELLVQNLEPTLSPNTLILVPQDKFSLAIILKMMLGKERVRLVEFKDLAYQRFRGYLTDYEKLAHFVYERSTGRSWRDFNTAYSEFLAKINEFIANPEFENNIASIRNELISKGLESGAITETRIGAKNYLEGDLFFMDNGVGGRAYAFPDRYLFFNLLSKFSLERYRNTRFTLNGKIYEGTSSIRFETKNIAGTLPASDTIKISGEYYDFIDRYLFNFGDDRYYYGVRFNDRHGNCYSYSEYIRTETNAYYVDEYHNWNFPMQEFLYSLMKWFVY